MKTQNLLGMAVQEGLQKVPYQLLKTFLPRVWLFIFFWVYLEELPCLWVHHGSCVFKNFHI